MYDFEPKSVNTYTIDQLIGFLKSKRVTFVDFQKAGLRYDTQEELMSIIQTDESDWRGACELNTIEGYQYYLDTHGTRALHDFEARMRIKKLEEYEKQLYEDLLNHMRDNVNQYKSNAMQFLFKLKTPEEAMLMEDSPKGRFLKAGLKLTTKHLIDKGLLPRDNKVLCDSVVKGDFVLPQLKFDELGDFPQDRTDVYFLGCPSSGKTCVLAGFLNYLRNIGQMGYVAQFNKNKMDLCRPYCDKLIEGISSYKAPQSTDRETISFLKIDTGANRDRKITIVELSGEAFEEMSNSNMNGRAVWEKMGAAQCLQNDSKKTLFFLLDYSTIIGQNISYSEVGQTLRLENALSTFCYDGPDEKDRTRHCTMSKVKTVAIIITKCDLMDQQEGRPLSKQERSEIAFKYLKEHCRNFMNELEKTCEEYGINNYKGSKFKPFVLTFSLGQFYVGNSVVYDDSDSETLANFILACTDKDYKGLDKFFK